MNIDWGVMADEARLDPWEFERRQKIRAALAAREREQVEQAQLERAQQRAQDAAQNDPPPSPEPAAKTQAVRYPSQPSVLTTPEQLLAALEAAPDDAARAGLLAAASRELRAKFKSMMIYHAMAEDHSADAPYVEFERRLAAAADDAERAAIISATDKALVAEWTWRQDATTDDWRRRYLAHCGEGDL